MTLGMKKRVIVLLVGVVVGSIAAMVGCSSKSSGGGGTSGDGGTDDGMSCAKIDSACGQPCDKGNSLGVGQYCSGISDCSNTKQAHLCSSLGNSAGSAATFFCTF